MNGKDISRELSWMKWVGTNEAKYLTDKECMPVGGRSDDFLPLQLGGEDRRGAYLQPGGVPGADSLAGLSRREWVQRLAFFPPFFFGAGLEGWRGCWRRIILREE